MCETLQDYTHVNDMFALRSFDAFLLEKASSSGTSTRWNMLKRAKGSATSQTMSRGNGFSCVLSETMAVIGGWKSQCEPLLDVSSVEGVTYVPVALCFTHADADRVYVALRACNLQALTRAINLVGMAVVLDTSKATENEHFMGIRAIKKAVVLLRGRIDQSC